MRPLSSGRAILAALVLVASPASAQTVALREDFESGQVPPSGWTEQRRDPGSIVFWRANHVLSNSNLQSGLNEWSAWHDYGPANTYDDNLLVSPGFDLSGFTTAWLHFYEYVGFASFRGNHWIDISIDGGTTWAHVIDSQAPGDQPVYTDVDISPAAGMNDVRIAFHYAASDGATWYVDQVEVNDDPATPPPPPGLWTVNLPASFADARGWNEDFEGLAGVVPPHMAVTEVDASTRLPDPEAWCNIGQRGPCEGGISQILPYSGTYHLELGLDPASVNWHDVRNALVVGLDGRGSRDLLLQFQVVDHGEELDGFDGIWLSADGARWHRLLGDWSPYNGTEWVHVTGLDLASTPVDVAKKFYLMIAQEDDLPLGMIEGVQLDDLVIAPAAPRIVVTPLVAGSVGGIDFFDFSQGTEILTAYSLTGPGPTPTAWGDALLSEPIEPLVPVRADARGRSAVTFSVPKGSTGQSIWFQAVDVVAGTLSNGAMTVVG